jgi:hypothetical protein
MNTRIPVIDIWFLLVPWELTEIYVSARRYLTRIKGSDPEKQLPALWI